MDMITITYNGKEVQKQEICPGICKSGSAFLVRCSITGVYGYCNEDRFQKLVAKFSSQEALGLKYVSRDGKRIQQGGEAKPVKVHATHAAADSTESKLDKEIAEYEERTGYTHPTKAWVAEDVRPPGYRGRK